MDEATVLRDVLERIDNLTQHIIEVKATMYRQEDFKVDAARLYDHIGTVQSQIAMAIKEAILAVEKRMDTEKASGTKAHEDLARHVEALTGANALLIKGAIERLTILERPQMPRWLISILSGAGALLASDVAQYAWRYFHPIGVH